MFFVKGEEEAIFFINANVMKDKEKLRNCSKGKETGDMTTKCSMGSWTGSCTGEEQRP